MPLARRQWARTLMTLITAVWLSSSALACCEVLPMPAPSDADMAVMMTPSAADAHAHVMAGHGTPDTVHDAAAHDDNAHCADPTLCADVIALATTTLPASVLQDVAGADAGDAESVAIIDTHAVLRPPDRRAGRNAAPTAAGPAPAAPADHRYRVMRI